MGTPEFDALTTAGAEGWAGIFGAAPELAASESVMSSRGLTVLNPDFIPTAETVNNSLRTIVRDVVAAGPGIRYQTALAMATDEGEIIVSGGVRDLTSAQISVVESYGARAAMLAGAHAEGTGLAFAGENGLLPTFGVLSTRMCPACESWIGSILEGSDFEFILDAGRKSFQFVPK